MEVLVGSLLENYAGTDADKPKLGTRYTNPLNGKKYIFVKYVGSAALAAKETVIISDASAFEVTKGSTLNDPDVAGVRPSGADSVAQNEYCWIQTHGNATCILGASATATVVGEGVVHDDDSDTGKIGGYVNDVTATVNQTTVNAMVNSVAGVFGRAQAVVSATDADVEVELCCRGFGDQ